MSRYYPALLKLIGKRCVVIGGGWGTDERVRDLLSAGAVVTLVAADASAELARLASDGKIRWEARGYVRGDLDGAFLAIACPADRAVNAEVWAEAEERGVPIDSIDDPAHSTFILPAIHRQGDLIVSVSSSGKSPALATLIRDRIAQELGPEYGELLDLLGQLRPEVTSRFASFERRRPIWHALARSGALDHLRAGDRAAALAELRRVLETA